MVDEFNEAFAGFPLISLLDFLSGYDQCVLAEESRDLTAFMTPFGLLRMTTLPQGYTNGVQVFDRFIRKVLSEQIAQGRSLPFVDDVGVRPNTRSFFQKGEEYKEVIPEVKKIRDGSNNFTRSDVGRYREIRGDCFRREE